MVRDCVSLGWPWQALLVKEGARHEKACLRHLRLGGLCHDPICRQGIGQGQFGIWQVIGIAPCAGRFGGVVVINPSLQQPRLNFRARRHQHNRAVPELAQITPSVLIQKQIIAFLKLHPPQSFA